MTSSEKKKRKAESRKKWGLKNKDKLRANFLRWKAKNPDHQKKWRARNPGKYRFYKLKSDYGLSQEQYEKLLTAQGGACAICRRIFVGSGVNGPLVDHNHQTGKVRGLLCGRCNLYLAPFDSDLFDRILAYKRAADGDEE